MVFPDYAEEEMLPMADEFAGEDMMLPKTSGMKDPRAKKQIEKALTGKSVSKLTRSRLLQMMAMNAAMKNSMSGGSQNG